jgi:hypothetical protein
MFRKRYIQRVVKWITGHPPWVIQSPAPIETNSMRKLIIAAITAAVMAGSAYAVTKCMMCNGTGWKGNFKCSYCHGTGGV